MNYTESVELLQATHEFPCPFMLKVIGRAENDFVGRVVAAVREALDLSFDPPYSTRETAGGRHVAVTLEPWVESAEEVLATYQLIRATDGIVLML